MPRRIFIPIYTFIELSCRLQYLDIFRFTTWSSFYSLPTWSSQMCSLYLILKIGESKNKYQNEAKGTMSESCHSMETRRRVLSLVSDNFRIPLLSRSLDPKFTSFILYFVVYKKQSRPFQLSSF